MTGVRILREDDVRAALPMAACIEAVERAFVAYSGGAAELPAVIHLDVPEARGGDPREGRAHPRGADLCGQGRERVLRGRCLRSTDSVLVFDARTGAPVAILLDGGYVTDMRTGAAGGVAARWLAPEDVAVVAVDRHGGPGAAPGGGVAVRARRHRRPRLGSLSGRHAAAAALDVGGIVARTAEEAVEGADVVITCTASTEPLVRAEWIARRHAHHRGGVRRRGQAGARSRAAAAADVLAVDSLDQGRRLGELQHALDAADRAVELGTICAGGAPGRTSSTQLTVCDLTGVGVQDVAAANEVLECGNAGDRVGEGGTSADGEPAQYLVVEQAVRAEHGAFV